MIRESCGIRYELRAHWGWLGGAVVGTRNVDWAAEVAMRNGRGRLSITSPVRPPFLVGPFQYELFDREGGVIVDSAVRSYWDASAGFDSARRRIAAREAIRPRSDAEFEIEDVPGEQRVAGVDAKLVRVRLRYRRTAVDQEEAEHPVTDVTATADLWLARVPGLPLRPFSPIAMPGGEPSAAPWREIDARIQDRGSILKYSLTRAIDVGEIHTSSMVTAEVTAIEPADVSLDDLIIPPEYSLRDTAGAATMARWLLPPSAC